MVEVHDIVGVPEEEPILLNLTIGCRPLHVGGKAPTLVGPRGRVPGNQHPEVLGPQSKTVVSRIRSIYDIRDLWPVEDTRIVRTDVEDKVCDVALTLAALSGCDR